MRHSRARVSATLSAIADAAEAAEEEARAAALMVSLKGSTVATPSPVPLTPVISLKAGLGSLLPASATKTSGTAAAPAIVLS